MVDIPLEQSIKTNIIIFYNFSPCIDSNKIAYDVLFIKVKIMTFMKYFRGIFGK